MAAFVSWEERVISNGKGKRLVHYYLRDGEGTRVLAVVGIEKSLRHMNYSVTSQFSKMKAASSPSSALDFGGSGGGGGCRKWKTRREVIDWLSTAVSDNVPCASLSMVRSSSDDDVEPTLLTSKGHSSGKMGHHSKDFSWLGSSWDCRKKRKHYRAFYRNGITISVHDFVHIIAEEYKTLVAYVEDLYEDLRANKMVVIRWFHKVDEVGIVLPSDVNDREIFFSLCLEDFSIQCIDGLAAVLSFQDYIKFQNEERHRFCLWQPYFCRRQIDNDDVKSFDITQIQGYWSQELLRSMYATPETSLKLRLRITRGGPKNCPNADRHSALKEKGQLNGAYIGAVGRDVKKPRGSSGTSSKQEKHVRTPLLRKQLLKQKLLENKIHLAQGCHAEVLSQDSGMRGCWFRCVVLKQHNDKVKVRYEDVQDADDTGKLEEWVVSSRIASPDIFGLRLSGRRVVRPCPSDSSKDSGSLDVGSVVDAWWHNGWWEGIVICKEFDGKLRVYFPGEQRDSIFGLGDLRNSQEWLSNEWHQIEDCQDVNLFLSNQNQIDLVDRWQLFLDGGKPVQTSEKEVEEEIQKSNHVSSLVKPAVSGNEPYFPSLSDVCHFANLKWSSSRKRRRPRDMGKEISRCTRQCGSDSSNCSQDEMDTASNACSKFLLPKTSVVVDDEKCKIGGSDPMLVTPMGLCTSLVMSQ